MPSYGQQITLTATVVVTDSPPPTPPSDPVGTMQFYDGAISIGSPVPVINGVAQLLTTTYSLWTPTVLTITGATQSGGNTVYTYSSFTGQTPAVGMRLDISGFVSPNTNNNINGGGSPWGNVGILTAVDLTAKTVTLVNNGSTVTHAATGTARAFIQGRANDGSFESGSYGPRSIDLTTGSGWGTIDSTAGNMLMVNYQNQPTTGDPTSTIADTGGNTWTLLSYKEHAFTPGNPIVDYVWYCIAKGGPTTITVTPAPAGTGGFGQVLGVSEWQGPLVLDQNVNEVHGAAIWDSSHSYNIGDQVAYLTWASLLYTAIAASTNQNPSTQPAYWTQASSPFLAPTITTSSANQLVIGSFNSGLISSQANVNNGFTWTVVEGPGFGSTIVEIYKDAPTVGTFTPSINITNAPTYTDMTTSWIRQIATGLSVGTHDLSAQYIPSVPYFSDSTSNTVVEVIT